MLPKLKAGPVLNSTPLAMVTSAGDPAGRGPDEGASAAPSAHREGCSLVGTLKTEENKPPEGRGTRAPPRPPTTLTACLRCGHCTAARRLVALGWHRTSRTSWAGCVSVANGRALVNRTVVKPPRRFCGTSDQAAARVPQQHSHPKRRGN